MLRSYGGHGSFFAFFADGQKHSQFVFLLVLITQLLLIASTIVALCSSRCIIHRVSTACFSDQHASTDPMAGVEQESEKKHFDGNKDGTQLGHELAKEEYASQAKATLRKEGDDQSEIAVTLAQSECITPVQRSYLAQRCRNCSIVTAEASKVY